MFAEGLVISIDQGIVSSNVIKSSTEDIKRLSGVINGANVILGESADSQTAAMSLTENGKPVIYLWKEQKSLATDKLTLRLSAAERTLSAGYQVSQDFAKPISPTMKSSYIQASLADDKITMESTDAVMVISYLSPNNDLQREKMKIINDAKNIAQTKAWENEKQKIKNNYHTRWDSDEKQRLLTKGSLVWYEPSPTWNLNKYPEFADSWRNVKFVRKRT